MFEQVKGAPSVLGTASPQVNAAGPTISGIELEWPLILAGQLPAQTLSAQENGWPSSQQLADLQAEDADIAAEFERLMANKQAESLDKNDQNIVAIVSQYCQFAYLQNCDILVLTARALPAPAVDMMTRFSARFTIIATVHGEIDDLDESILDRRTGESSDFGLLLSPYKNLAFDIATGFTLTDFKSTFRREPVPNPKTFTLSAAPGVSGLTVTVSGHGQELPIYNYPFPKLAEFSHTHDGWQNTKQAAVLFDAVDRHGPEIDAAVRNASKIRNPKSYILELTSRYEASSLTARERHALDLLADSKWLTVEANPIEILRLPTLCSTDEELQHKALKAWLPSINNFISIARAKHSEAAAVVLQHTWSSAAASMASLQDVPLSQRQLSDRISSDSNVRTRRLVFSAHLTSTAGDKLEESFQRQARLLSVLVRLPPPTASLDYQIGTYRDTSGHLQPRVTVECWASDATEIETAALRLSLACRFHGMSG